MTDTDTITHILMITDASGSMRNLAEDVRGGHNEYLDNLIADGAANARITSTVFNTKVTVLDKAMPPNLATRFTESTYRPDGYTALLDAIGMTLHIFIDEVRPGPTDKVVVFIQTDGGENASKEFDRAAVASRIAELEATGVAFVFSGVGPDGWADRGSVGLTHASTTNTATAGGTRALYKGRYQATNVAMASPGPMYSAEVSGLIQASIDEAEETK